MPKLKCRIRVAPAACLLASFCIPPVHRAANGLYLLSEMVTLQNLYRLLSEKTFRLTTREIRSEKHFS